MKSAIIEAQLVSELNCLSHNEQHSFDSQSMCVLNEPLKNSNPQKSFSRWVLCSFEVSIAEFRGSGIVPKTFGRGTEKKDNLWKSTCDVLP